MDEKTGKAHKAISANLRAMVESVHQSGSHLRAGKIEGCCIRCLFDGANDRRPVSSHVIPHKILRQTYDKDGGSASGKIFAPNLLPGEGFHGSVEVAMKEASVLPLFCNENDAARRTCEGFFASNGETKIVELFGSKFISACAAFAERLAFAKQHSLKLSVEKANEAFDTEWTKIIPAMKMLGREKFAPEIYDHMKSQNAVQVAGYEYLLNHDVSSPRQAVKRLRRAEESWRGNIFYVILKRPAPWKVGEMNFLDLRGRAPMWLFTFSMQVLVNGDPHEAVIFMPIVADEDKSLEVRFGLRSVRGGFGDLALSDNWAIFKKQLVLNLLYAGFSCDQIYYGSRFKKEIESLSGIALKRRLGEDKAFESAFFELLSTPGKPVISEWDNQSTFNKFCEENLLAHPWRVGAIRDNQHLFSGWNEGVI